jgi:hypothetical protein
MDFSSYSGLQSAVTEWLARSDLATEVPSFILLAESLINQKLRHRKMEAVTSITPSSNVCALPSDFLKARKVSYGTKETILEGMTPEIAKAHYRYSGASTSAYTIVGDNLELYPSGTEDIELTYYQKLPALSDSNTSNWLLVEAPHLYLSAAKAMAADFVGDAEEYQKNVAISGTVIQSLNEQSDIALYSNMRYMPKGVTP